MDSIFLHSNPDPAPAGDGPLRGLKVALQPNLAAAGWPAGAGSRALAGYLAPEDATIVRRLRQAGAMLPGYTRMSEFGWGLQGSEAGRALREHAADAELVLDLAGESRVAAARAGACGFKPSYGLVSRFGLIGLMPSLEVCGVLAGTPAKIRGILQAVAGQDEHDFSMADEPVPDFAPPKTKARRPSLGIVTEALDLVSGEQAQAFRDLQGSLARSGFIVREVSCPDFPLFALVHRIIGSVEASSSTGRYDSVRYGPRAPGARNWNEMYLQSRGAAFGPLLKRLLFQGAFFQFERYEAYENACRIRARLLAAMQRLSAQADVLALPAGDGEPGGNPATPADIWAGFSPTLFANVTGQPALILPPAPDGARPAIQLAAARLQDARLLAAGEELLDAFQGDS